MRIRGSVCVDACWKEVGTNVHQNVGILGGDGHGRGAPTRDGKHRGTGGAANTSPLAFPGRLRTTVQALTRPPGNLPPRQALANVTPGARASYLPTVALRR